MAFPLDAGQQAALDEAFGKVLREHGLPNSLPFSLSAALASGESFDPTNVNSLTFTNTDNTTAAFTMPFGFGILSLDFGPGTANYYGLHVNGQLSVFGDSGNPGNINLSSAASPDPTGFLSGSIGWADGQSLYENPTGTLGTQYLGTTSGFAVGYSAPGVAAKNVYLNASTGDVTAIGRGTFATLGVGNAASATTPGACVKKIEIFDASGVSLGFIPVYSSIT